MSKLKGDKLITEECIKVCLYDNIMQLEYLFNLSFDDWKGAKLVLDNIEHLDEFTN